MKKNEDEKNFSLKTLILPKLIIEKKLQYFSTELIDYIVKKYNISENSKNMQRNPPSYATTGGKKGNSRKLDKSGIMFGNSRRGHLQIQYLVS